LKSRVVRRVRCLVVVPVGDLAAQVHAVFSDYCQHTELKVCLITGSIARSANLPVFSLLRGRFMPNFTPIGATTRV